MTAFRKVAAPLLVSESRVRGLDVTLLSVTTWPWVTGLSLLCVTKRTIFRGQTDAEVVGQIHPLQGDKNQQPAATSCIASESQRAALFRPKIVVQHQSWFCRPSTDPTY